MMRHKGDRQRFLAAPEAGQWPETECPSEPAEGSTLPTAREHVSVVVSPLVGDDLLQQPQETTTA